MDDEQKRSGLMKIIEHGDANQRGVAMDYLIPLIIKAGDFQTASELITKYPDVFTEPASSKDFINKTSKTFMDSLQYDNAKDVTESLVDYLNIQSTPQKNIAKKQFRLYAILGLHQTMLSRYCVNGHFLERMPEFKDVKYIYDVMQAMQIMKNNADESYRSFPTEIRSAIGVSYYLHQLLDERRDYSNTSDINDVNIIKDTKIEFSEARNHFDSAQKGYHTSLEDRFKDAKKGSTEARFIKALIPCAVMHKLITEYDYNLLFEYKRYSEFEKGSKVFEAVERYAPLFKLENIRIKLKTDSNLTDEESARLFDINENANDFIKPFSTMIKGTYLTKLCQTYMTELKI